MGREFDWIAVWKARGEVGPTDAANELRAHDFASDGGQRYTHPAGVVVEYQAAARAVLPWDEDRSAPNEIAGWYVVECLRDEDAALALAQDVTLGLAKVTRSFVAHADGLGFSTHDGREAETIDNVLELLELGSDEDDEDERISIDWDALKARKSPRFVIVYRGDRAFSARELQLSLSEGVEVQGATAGNSRWRSLHAIDPALVWELQLDRVSDGEVPFYVRASFDWGEAALGEPPSDSDIVGVVDFARDFTICVEQALGLTPIDLEYG